MVVVLGARRVVHTDRQVLCARLVVLDAGDVFPLLGVGGLHLLVRLAWADYYGRQHLGTIRGLSLSAQIGGQALGPVLAGFLFDATDSYRVAFLVFALAVWSGGLLVLAAVPPQMPAAALPADTNP